MKALFIGGTGTISMAITTRLIAEGCDLYLLNRGNRPAPEGAKLLKGDIKEEAAMEALLRDQSFDVVVDFIAFTEEDIQRDYRLFKGKTRQFLFISSASAYQKPLSRLPITESTPLSNPHWEYSRNKIACEEALMRYYREEAFPITIVRPSHTYDNRGVPVGLHGANGGWQVLRRMQEGKPVIVHGDGSSLWTFTHNSDFAKGFIGLMGNPHAIGEAVHITSDESLSWNQAYGIIAQQMGVDFQPVYVPSSTIIKLGAREGYDFEGPLLGDKACTVLFDNSKIKRLVPGFACVKRYDQGVRESLANLYANPTLQKTDEKFDAFCDMLARRMEAAEA